VKRSKKPEAPQMEHDLYMRVVSMDAESAMSFAGISARPVDLGPADPERYRDGARVWGFPSRPETAEEKATRLWTVKELERLDASRKVRR
jgi:hypothetical protein